MELASVFYILGIAFFLSAFFVMIAAIIAGIVMYQKLQHLKEQAPFKVVQYLQQQNTTGLKALAVSLIGMGISQLTQRIKKKSA